MVNDLKLSGNELICYALIYGFTQDEESEFRGSLQYISDWLGISKQNVRLIIKRLVEKGLIIKRDEFINNVKFCRYTVCMKQPQGMNVSCMGVGMKQPLIIIVIIIKIIKRKKYIKKL